jgi:hypothetical protein
MEMMEHIVARTPFDVTARDIANLEKFERRCLARAAVKKNMVVWNFPADRLMRVERAE